MHAWQHAIPHSTLNELKLIRYTCEALNMAVWTKLGAHLMPCWLSMHSNDCFYHILTPALQIAPLQDSCRLLLHQF